MRLPPAPPRGSASPSSGSCGRSWSRSGSRSSGRCGCRGFVARRARPLRSLAALQRPRDTRASHEQHGNGAQVAPELRARCARAARARAAFKRRPSGA